MSVRHVGAWLLWGVPCFWLWQLVVGAWTPVNIVAGVLAAAVAATIAELARASAAPSLRVPSERLVAAAGVPIAVIVDFAILSRALAVSVARRRPVRGRYIVREFDPGAGRTGAGAAHRAWTVLLAGYSPNAYVVDIDAEAGRVLVHDLVPRRSSEEPA